MNDFTVCGISSRRIVIVAHHAKPHHMQMENRTKCTQNRERRKNNKAIKIDIIYRRRYNDRTEIGGINVHALKVNA